MPFTICFNYILFRILPSLQKYVICTFWYESIFVSLSIISPDVRVIVDLYRLSFLEIFSPLPQSSFLSFSDIGDISRSFIIQLLDDLFCGQIMINFLFLDHYLIIQWPLYRQIMINFFLLDEFCYFSILVYFPPLILDSSAPVISVPLFFRFAFSDSHGEKY